MGKVRRLCYSVHEAMRPTDTNEAVQDEIVVVPNFRARKQQAVREIIWEAAIDLFEQKGYDETTVDEVAQAAGISQRSFFRYFATKGDLMAYALVTYADQLIAAIDACPNSYSLGEVFRETLVQVAQEAVTHPRTRKIFDILSKSAAAAGAEMSRLAEVQALVAKAFARRFPESQCAAARAHRRGGELRTRPAGHGPRAAPAPVHASGPAGRTLFPALFPVGQELLGKAGI